MKICATSPVPDGFAFVTIGNIDACNGSGYKLVEPKNNAILCNPSPLPKGFLKIEKDNYIQCEDNGDLYIDCGGHGGSIRIVHANYGRTQPESVVCQDPEG